MSEKKKIFPKLKKQISNFLTDESGEITKKDALGIAAGAALLSGVETADAAHTNTWNPGLPTVNWGKLVTVSNMTCSHVSGVVNGHLSQTPQVGTAETIHTHSNAHASHNNTHSSHSSGGWC